MHCTCKNTLYASELFTLIRKLDLGVFYCNIVTIFIGSPCGCMSKKFSIFNINSFFTFHSKCRRRLVLAVPRLPPPPQTHPLTLESLGSLSCLGSLGFLRQLDSQQVHVQWIPYSWKYSPGENFIFFTRCYCGRNFYPVNFFLSY